MTETQLASALKAEDGEIKPRNNIKDIFSPLGEPVPDFLQETIELIKERDKLAVENAKLRKESDAFLAVLIGSSVAAFGVGFICGVLGIRLPLGE